MPHKFHLYLINYICLVVNKHSHGHGIHNGMLRHAYEPLEGSNILWHNVGPPPPVPPISSLFLFILHPILCLLIGIDFLKSGCVRGNSLYEKLRNYLGKREKLDLRSTKSLALIYYHVWKQAIQLPLGSPSLKQKKICPCRDSNLGPQTHFRYQKDDLDRSAIGPALNAKII